METFHIFLFFSEKVNKIRKSSVSSEPFLQRIELIEVVGDLLFHFVGFVD